MNRKLLLLLVVAGCTEKAAAPVDESKVQAVHAVPDTAAPVVPTAPGALVKAPGRTLHPLGGETCTERYTACTKVAGKPDDCRAVDFGLQCGESKRLPQTGEMLNCVCP